MSSAVKEAGIENEDLVRALPRHLAENFEKADQLFFEEYGFRPGVPALLRMWLACSTSSRIKAEFELGTMNLMKPEISGLSYFEDDILEQYL